MGDWEEKQICGKYFIIKHGTFYKHLIRNSFLLSLFNIYICAGSKHGGNRPTKAPRNKGSEILNGYSDSVLSNAF